MKMVSELASLRGKSASTELTRLLSRLGKQAEADNLTESDIARMIDESE
ncbi:hypothetical protein [Candidatus Glomeribacter gigasporarum]|nr:hypothetical protein [Candidatus Glomeribacter gigasporarum]